jgi:hypothetical protein
MDWDAACTLAEGGWDVDERAGIGDSMTALNMLRVLLQWRKVVDIFQQSSY